MHGNILGTALFLSLLSAAALAQSPPSPERAEAREKMRMACAADIQRFCANIERAKGAMRSCLEQNQTGLSQECNAARAERAAVRAKEKG
jgi:hypothetical protein